MGLISNGTTIFDNGVVNAGGSMTFISKATASASASIEFTSGIDSTYKEYIFYFVNMHPASDAGNFEFNLSTDNGSNYNVTKTTTYFRAFHSEGGAGGVLQYESGYDLAQGTGMARLSHDTGADADQNLCGYFHLFNPSSTTFVKHFMFDSFHSGADGGAANTKSAGYFNTTSAINAIDFKFFNATSNIDDGTIKLYGIKDS